MLIAGIDLSTRRVDAAFLPVDVDVPGAPFFRTKPIRQLDGSAERIRDAGHATRLLLRGLEVAAVCVERPAGKFGAYALLPVFGAVIASTPRDAAVAWLGPTEWRRELGLDQSKEGAATGLAARLLGLGYEEEGIVDEHQLDALGVTLAWRNILNRHQYTPTGRNRRSARRGA